MLGCQSIGLGFDLRHWPGCTGHDTMGVTEHHRPSMQWHYHIKNYVLIAGIYDYCNKKWIMICISKISLIPVYCNLVIKVIFTYLFALISSFLAIDKKTENLKNGLYS